MSDLISIIINTILIINLKSHYNPSTEEIMQYKNIIMSRAIFVTCHVYTLFSCIIKNRPSFLEQHKDIKSIKIMQE